MNRKHNDSSYQNSQNSYISSCKVPVSGIFYSNLIFSYIRLNRWLEFAKHVCLLNKLEHVCHLSEIRWNTRISFYDRIVTAATVNISEIYSSRHKKVVSFFSRCSLPSPLLTGILARGLSATLEHALKLTRRDGASFVVRKRGLRQKSNGELR